MNIGHDKIPLNNKKDNIRHRSVDPKKKKFYDPHCDKNHRNRSKSTDAKRTGGGYYFKSETMKDITERKEKKIQPKLKEPEIQKKKLTISEVDNLVKKNILNKK